MATVYLAVTTHINNNNVQTYDALAFFNTSCPRFFSASESLVGLFATFFPETSHNGRLAAFSGWSVLT